LTTTKIRKAADLIAAETGIREGDTGTGTGTGTGGVLR
jgi:hypothetical protein